jgi:2-polyprenyl-6-methoxyphenol hydroxylase-like FAD-dependent oxidoreductase
MAGRLTVVVIGGGIGGLCLAQRLRKAGVGVEVYERDRAAGSRWEGYRIYVNPAGSRSLRACLPDPLWAAFLATSGVAGPICWLTEQLDELVVVEESVLCPQGAADPAENHYAVDRRTLRRLLLSGLEDVVHFGAEFRRYEHTADGRVAAFFADGRRVVGDVLVGADGAGSRVRRQYLPQAGHVDAGVGGVAHKFYLTAENRTWVPRQLQRGMNSVVVDGPVQMFTAVYDPPPGARAALEHIAVPPAENLDAPYLLCAVNADPALLPEALTSLDDAALRRTVDELVADWHPALRRILAESDPASRGAIRFTASVEVAPWESSAVTVLGDAIHTMPPLGGFGGNTALRDARLLGGLLAEADRGERDLLDAVRHYEDGMREHGYAAIRAALRMRDRALRTGAVGALAVRTWFRLCRALPALRRRTFSPPPDAVVAPRPWERPGARV